MTCSLQRNLQEAKLNSILQKLESFETNQRKTAQDVRDLKDSYNFLEDELTEVKTALVQKANRANVAAYDRKIEDLENRSKRNNVVIWGLKEDAEKNQHDSVEEFLKENLFNRHMGLNNIEDM